MVEEENKVIEEPKKEEKEKTKDPLDGKSIDELKNMVKDLQQKNTDNVKKIRGFTVMLQGMSFKLKELGIDLGMIGRNTDQMLDGIVNDKLPERVSNQMGL